MERILRGWILCDQGKIGTLRQCEAVVSILQESQTISFETIDITLPKILQFLPVWFGKLLWPQVFFKKTSSYPDVIIVAGRRSVMAFLSMRGFKGKSIAILNPRVSLTNFDIVIAPQHDLLKGNNLITIQGSLHNIRPDVLQQTYAKLSKPMIAVMIGGNSKYYQYTQEDAQKITEHIIVLRDFVDPNATICITASRRTPVFMIDIIRDLLAGHDFEFWNGERENPYRRYIAQASAIMVTSDSISMMSEVCITGKPVYIYEVPIQNQKFIRFINSMISAHHYSKVGEWRASSWFMPLDEYQKVKKYLGIMDL